jgi:hypothetical protein
MSGRRGQRRRERSESKDGVISPRRALVGAKRHKAGLVGPAFFAWNWAVTLATSVQNGITMWKSQILTPASHSRKLNLIFSERFQLLQDGFR